MRKFAIAFGIGASALLVAGIAYRVAVALVVPVWVSGVIWWASLAIVLGLGIVSVRRWQWW